MIYWVLAIYGLVFLAMSPLFIRAQSVALKAVHFMMAVLWPVAVIVGGVMFILVITHAEWEEILGKGELGEYEV